MDGSGISGRPTQSARDRTRWVSGAGRYVADVRAEGALAAAFNDMADRLARDEQWRRDMTADLSHELRTPLATIQSRVEALEYGVMPATPENLRIIGEEVERLGRLLGALRSLNELLTVRQALVQANQFGSLNDLALAVSDLTVLEGTIRHVAQGYSGISAAVRVQPKDLERLYEYDYGFVLAARQLRTSVDPLAAAARANDPARIATEVGRVRGLVGELRQAFQVRLHSVEGIQV
jgi:signal transduction histidine kinase